MKFKLKSKIVSFVIAIALLSITAYALVSYADWQNGNTVKSVHRGQSATFDLALFSVNPSLTYSVKMYDSSDNIVKTWHDNTADSDGWVEETLALSSSDTNKSGEYDIIISSIDGNGDSGYSALTLTVQNEAPTIGSITIPASIVAGNLLSASFTASDTDGDALSYSIYSNDILVSSTNSYDWMPSNRDAGTYTFRFEVSDGEYSDSETRTVTVTASSAPPVIPSEIWAMAKATLVFDRDLEISQYENYLKIRNTKGEPINDFEIIMTYLGVNAHIERYNFDLGKNAVVMKPFTAELPENGIYVAKVEIQADELEDSGYLIINK